MPAIAGSWGQFGCPGTGVFALNNNWPTDDDVHGWLTMNDGSFSGTSLIKFPLRNGPRIHNPAYRGRTIPIHGFQGDVRRHGPSNREFSGMRPEGGLMNQATGSTFSCWSRTGHQKTCLWQLVPNFSRMVTRLESPQQWGCPPRASLPCRSLTSGAPAGQ